MDPLAESIGAIHGLLDDYGEVPEDRVDRETRRRIAVKLDDVKRELTRVLASMSSKAKPASAEEMQLVLASMVGCADDREVIDRLISTIGGRWGWLDDPATHNEPYLAAMELLADTHERLGELRDAAFYVDRAAHIVGCLHGFESLDYVHRVMRAANMMARAGYNRSAGLALNEAKTLAERAAGSDHPLVVKIRESIDVIEGGGTASDATERR